MEIVRVAHALSDPLRWKILKEIAASRTGGCCTVAGQGEDQGLCVCHLVGGMGLLQSKVSYHIKELKKADLIREETRGRWNYYSLKKETLREYLRAMQGEFGL